MLINTAADYKHGYEMLSIFNDPAINKHYIGKDALKDHVDALKRDLRKFAHKDNMVDVGMGFKVERRIVQSDFDGYIELVSIPTVFDNIYDAESFFEDFIAMPHFNSMYDCTGRPFTAWYKIFKRNGQFYAYHSVCLDV